MGIEAVAKSSLGILENIFHNAQVGIAICNGENYILEMVNPAFATIYGYESSELIGVSSSKIFPPECIVQLSTLDDTQDKFSFETVHSKKDGTLVYLSVCITKIKGENQYLVHLIDISESKYQEERLTKTKAKLAAVITTIPDLIWLKDINGIYLMCNPAFERFFGASCGEILGKTDYEFIRKEQADFFRQKDKEALEAGKMCINEEEIIFAQNGQYALLETRKMPIYFNGEFMGVLGIGRDITEKIRVEKEFQLQSEQLFKSEKMAAMGEMIGNIAHQWRQPLNIISVMTSGIALKKEFGTLKDEELISYTNKILIQTEYLSKTIDDFRNFIKGDKEESILNISSLFGKTLSIVDSSLQSHYIKVITNIDETLEMRGYENELMQAFINIINNAKDALIANDTIQDKYIFIEAKSKDNQCEIIIKDNGGGINPSVINRIFEPYFTTKHKSLGTGLGLAMAHKIIAEVNKGTIIASNETYEYTGKEYTGACFTIRFFVRDILKDKEDASIRL